ncbi:hypothetical protein Nepgr_019759 [Nepenthes gracilis]|uniref:BHLH domain-containing protein n=1 Tax=Nepenthes gracilis TaxID=150966 RepID=A0AAD3SUN7_NEPGR|nr:hypothetical protein Nepgr_019759 [Nepenthes gracilis]
MEVSMFKYLGEDDLSFVHGLETKPLEEFVIQPQSAGYGENLQHYSSQILGLKPSTRRNPFVSERNPEQLEADALDFQKIGDVANTQDPSSELISFANSNYLNQEGFIESKDEAISTVTFPFDILASQGSFGSQNCALKASQGAKTIGKVTARLKHTQDHITAERKRREKLTQQFIALSAIVPGLKKMDKASVLGDAIKYLKQLQEQVKTLEEQTRNRPLESAVDVKRTRLQADDNDHSRDETTHGNPLPEIEARFSDRNVLVRIHCEKKNGVLEKIITELENLHLIVISSSAMTFGSSSIDVTIISQMDVEFYMTAKDIVKHLYGALEQFM